MSETDYIVKQLETLVNIPSPSGYTKQAIEYVEQTAKELGFESTRLRKGGLVILVPGKNPTPERVIGLSAHVDTLGAMVRSINANGTLRMIYDGVGGKYVLQGRYQKRKDLHRYDSYQGTGGSYL